MIGQEPQKQCRPLAGGCSPHLFFFFPFLFFACIHPSWASAVRSVVGANHQSRTVTVWSEGDSDMTGLVPLSHGPPAKEATDEELGP